MDYREPICPFDTSDYTGVPDAEPTGRRMNVPMVIRQLDEMIHAGRAVRAQHFLEDRRAEAAAMGDWRAELSMLSELMGQYRFGNKREEGLRAVSDGLALIREHHLGSTVSGATVMLNAATTLQVFGCAAEALPIFEHVSRVYADNLDPADYRFAGLYNNMAQSCAAVGEAAKAERCYKLALEVLRRCGGQQNDMAVTWCSLAELYAGQDPEDARVEDCVERAWDCLNAPELAHDGYHGLTLQKCIPCFDYFGFFLYAGELRERLAKIRERT